MCGVYCGITDPNGQVLVGLMNHDEYLTSHWVADETPQRKGYNLFCWEILLSQLFCN